MTGAAATTIRHLRPRGDGAAQPTTTVEVFFDLVYVFAVTQLSHQIIDDLSIAGVARGATASKAGLTSAVVLCLAVAFAQTAAGWELRVRGGQPVLAPV